MSHEGAALVSLLDPHICYCKAHDRDKQTDRPRYMRSNKPHLYAMHCDASKKLQRTPKLAASLQGTT